MTMKKIILALALMAMLFSIASVLPVAAQAPEPVGLYLSPATRSALTGDVFSVDIVVQRNGQSLHGLDVFLNFDPGFLQVQGIAAGAGSPFNFELNNSFDNVAGYADYSAGALNSPAATPIIFATVTFQAKAPTALTQLAFNRTDPRPTRAAYAGSLVAIADTGATVTISGSTQAAAAFSSDVTSGVQPLTVNFTDSSTGSPTAWAWDFGDGSTSAAKNPSHTYVNPGSFTVALTITAATGQSTMTRNAYITVLAPTPTPLPEPTATLTPTPMPSSTPTPTSTVTSATATPGSPTQTLLPSGSPSPTPGLPSSGGNNFTSILPWVIVAAAVFAIAGVVVARSARKG